VRVFILVAVLLLVAGFLSYEAGVMQTSEQCYDIMAAYNQLLIAQEEQHRQLYGHGFDNADPRYRHPGGVTCVGTSSDCHCTGPEGMQAADVIWPEDGCSPQK
jgi:hypothetical protein